MQREVRTTKALFLICLSYLIFVGPVTISDVIHDLKLYDDESSLHSDFHLIIINIYWLQFSCNFFIYAARSEQFRMAYLYFLKNVSSHKYIKERIFFFLFHDFHRNVMQIILNLQVKKSIIEYSSNRLYMVYIIDQESTSIIRK